MTISTAESTLNAKDMSHGSSIEPFEPSLGIWTLCPSPNSDFGSRHYDYDFPLLPRVEGQGRAALAQFRRHRWPECSRLARLSGFYDFIDPVSMGTRSRWHSRMAATGGTNRPQLRHGRLGGFDWRAIIRHARISHLTTLRGLSSQSWTVFYAAVRSRGPFFIFGLSSRSGSRPRLCAPWVFCGSSVVRGGIAIAVAAATGDTLLATSPLVALATGTVMGINEALICWPLQTAMSASR